MATCEQCGGPTAEGASCADRFSALLALDHSRQEPWGSRHGLAFAAFTLQHPNGESADALDRCWAMLCRVYIAGDDPADVARGLRSGGSRNPVGWAVPPRPPARPATGAFTTTIGDLGDFEAASYPAGLDAWCRATLLGWGVGIEAT